VDVVAAAIDIDDNRDDPEEDHPVTEEAVDLLDNEEEAGLEHSDLHGDTMDGGDHCCRCCCFLDMAVEQPLKKMMVVETDALEEVVALRPDIDGGDEVEACVLGGYCCLCRGAVDCIPHCRQDRCLVHSPEDHRIFHCCYLRCWS